MQMPVGDSVRASTLTVLLHTVMLGGLLISFSQSTTTTAPRVIPISVVAPSDLASAPPPAAAKPTPPTAVKTTDITPKAAPPPPVNRPPAPRFNPYLLNSAQYNPAIFSSTNTASSPQSAAAPVAAPIAPSYSPPPISGYSLNSTTTAKGKRIVNKHRARVENQEVIVTTFSDGSWTTQSIIEDRSLGRIESTVHSGGSLP